jgi:zona occludens toxin (predicted ATPase)
VGIDPKVFIDLYNEEHSTEHRAIQDLLAENSVMQLPKEQKKISWKVPATFSLAILLVIGVVQIVISNQSSTTPSAPQVEVTQSATPTASAGVAQSATPSPSTSAITPIRSGPITLKIVAARGNSYIDIVIDGKRVSKGSLFQGDSKSFTGNTAISIYLSNPAGLDLTLNGKALAPLGGQNEEVRRTFR